jgi:thiol-disulfide isomerase/thioredoxin
MSLASLIALLAVGAAAASGASPGRPAPDFTAGGPWFNTRGKALTISALRGRVVAVEMFTAGCYNCRNVMPALKRWDASYRTHGLIIVGVHAPEFAYERSEDYVRASIVKLGLKYPVVMDNNFKIWRSYNNVYWPTIYLVDKKGIVRYMHVGEGAYAATENKIRELLAENG